MIRIYNSRQASHLGHTLGSLYRELQDWKQRGDKIEGRRIEKVEITSEVQMVGTTFAHVPVVHAHLEEFNISRDLLGPTLD